MGAYFSLGPEIQLARLLLIPEVTGKT